MDRATDVLVERMAQQWGPPSNTKLLERHHLSDFLFVEDDPKTKMYSTSMFQRKASNYNKVIPRIGQLHVLAIARGIISVVLCCVGGTRCCGERCWYAISRETRSGRLHATVLVALAPSSSSEFPRRSLMFCPPCPAVQTLVAPTRPKGGETII